MWIRRLLRLRPLLRRIDCIQLHEVLIARSIIHGCRQTPSGAGFLVFVWSVVALCGNSQAPEAKRDVQGRWGSGIVFSSWGSCRHFLLHGRRRPVVQLPCGAVITRLRAAALWFECQLWCSASVMYLAMCGEGVISADLQDKVSCPPVHQIRNRRLPSAHRSAAEEPP